MEMDAQRIAEAHNRIATALAAEFGSSVGVPEIMGLLLLSAAMHINEVDASLEAFLTNCRTAYGLADANRENVRPIGYNDPRRN